MTLERIREVLEEALPLRCPRCNDPDASPGRKAEELQDYMLQSANIAGGLWEAKHWLRALRAQLADEWERLKGWEVATTKRRERLTAADINRAKTQVAPAQYEAGREARRLAESVDDQIERLDREARACSRAYSMLSGT